MPLPILSTWNKGEATLSWMLEGVLFTVITNFLVMRTTFSLFLPCVIIKNVLAYSLSTDNMDTHCHVSGNGLFSLSWFLPFSWSSALSLYTWLCFLFSGLPRGERIAFPSDLLPRDSTVLELINLQYKFLSTLFLQSFVAQNLRPALFFDWDLPNFISSPSWGPIVEQVKPFEK